MSTANVAIVCNDYTGTNTLKIALYKQSDPLTEVAADFHAGPFAQAVFSFFSLERVTHFRRLYEVDNTDQSIVLATYGDRFFFIPEGQEIEWKDGVEWTAGVDYMPNDTLYPSGVNTFTNPDWIGWQVDSFTQFINGFPSSTYHNDPTTGEFTLLTPDAIFEYGVTYRVTFKLHSSAAGGSGGGGYMAGKKYVTGNTTLTAADAGKKILCKGTSQFFTITLPTLSTMPELVPFFFEMPPFVVTPPSVDSRSVRIIPEAGKVIDFGKGGMTEIFLKPSETIEIYKEADNQDPENVHLMWRVQHPDGNFLTAGEFIPEYAEVEDTVNKVALDGGGASGLDAFLEGRLYAYVLKLDASKVVPYYSWGGDKTKFSYKDPINNKFRIPDLRGLYFRMSSGTLNAGQYLKNAAIDHVHAESNGENPVNGAAYGTAVPNLGQYNATGTHKRDITSKPLVLATPGGYREQESSDETRPETIVANGYIRT